MVFQQFHLFPHLTAIGNVSLAPRIVRRVRAGDAREAGSKLLALVGLEGFEDRYPAQLSGGQQQRVAIARSLAMDPAVILYDEPTSALDPELRAEVQDVMRRLDERGVTQIVVTHEMAFARRAADRVLFFDAGRVVEAGSPEAVFDSPKDERTRRFVAGGGGA
jgi:ABC-type polar amino acid transport system ATPase subunit